MSKYAFGKTVTLGFDATVEKITAELAKEGFGILTEIDVSATMKKKLNADIPPYKILGACNPQFAHRAIGLEPQIGALLPCNVVVRQDAAGKVQLEFMDPNAVLTLVDRPEMKEIAKEVRQRLENALARV
jgi:uncharacterized protein (DUF302 family)